MNLKKLWCTIVKLPLLNRESNMHISQEGIALIKKFEGCELEAYVCPAGKLTIGYGRIKDVKEGDTCTCLLYTSPSPRDGLLSRMPSSA